MMDRPVLLRHFHALQPGGKSLRDVLLPEAFLSDPGGIALHRDRPSADVRQHHRRDRLVIGREISFRDSIGGEQDLLRMVDHDTTSSSREWRSLSCTVHSMKATRTTISGRTQCARTRGSPLDLVNGACGVSSAFTRDRNSSSSLVSNPVPTLPAKTKSHPSK